MPAPRPASTLSVTLLTLAVACGGGAKGQASSLSAGESATGGTASGGGDSGTAGASGGATGGSTGAVRFDVGLPQDTPGGGAGDCGGGGMGGDILYSYIWIANSAEGTVSKINTMTGVEEGRYWTDASMGGGNPSRTSVNLIGDVAVSNRDNPSTTKIAARPERCVDANNNGMIDTSTGPNDVLPWGEDECMIWHVAFPDCVGGVTGPRPTQWQPGQTQPNDCPDPNPPLWVGYEDTQGVAQFVVLDGDTGAELGRASYDWSGVPGGTGPYGGVVNADGDLYASALGVGPLVHVTADTLEVTDLGQPAVSGGFYGIGIDAKQNPWIAGGDTVSIWDVTLQDWVVIFTGNSNLRGIQIDRDERAWVAGNSPCGLVALDTATRTVLHDQVELPGCMVPVGISIDVEGYVWSPDQGAHAAYKVDPNTLQTVLAVEGLVSPYTYSDMTGAALSLVSSPPEG